MIRVTRDEFHREMLRVHPDRPRFAGRDLSGIDLSSHRLGPIDFSRANLRGADLHEARLDGGEFSGADLSDVDLRGASLRHAWLKGARLAGADLRDADLSHAMLARTDLHEARLRGAWMDGVELSGTELPAHWRSITRVHHVADDPFARHDVVAAVRRDLADSDRPAALLTLRSHVGVSADLAEVLLERLLATSSDSLAALRLAELPEPLERSLAAITTPPPSHEVATLLASLADAEPEACRRHGLRWTIERALHQRRTIEAVTLLRRIGLDLPASKSLLDQMSDHAERMLEACTLVDDDQLAAGADRLASELWGLEFDIAARVLWSLRAGLHGPRP